MEGLEGILESWDLIRDHGAFESDLIWFAYIKEYRNVIALTAIEFSPVDKSVFKSKQAYLDLIDYLNNLPYKRKEVDNSVDGVRSNSPFFNQLVSKGVDVYDWDESICHYRLEHESKDKLIIDQTDSSITNILSSVERSSSSENLIDNHSIDMRDFIKHKLVFKADHRNWFEKKLNINQHKIEYELQEDGIIEGSSFVE